FHAASTKMLATRPERSLIRRLSSSRVTIENASKCYSHTSSAFCGWAACGCVVLVARKMSSRSAPSHRTCDGSPNWSPDHHPRLACTRSQRQYGVKPRPRAAPKRLLQLPLFSSPTFATKSANSRPCALLLKSFYLRGARTTEELGLHLSICWCLPMFCAFGANLFGQAETVSLE